MDINMEMTVGYLGNFDIESIKNMQDVTRALGRGAIFGPYILDDVLYKSGIGLWENNA